MELASLGEEFENYEIDIADIPNDEVPRYL